MNAIGMTRWMTFVLSGNYRVVISHPLTPGNCFESYRLWRSRCDSIIKTGIIYAVSLSLHLLCLHWIFLECSSWRRTSLAEMSCLKENLPVLRCSWLKNNNKNNKNTVQRNSAGIFVSVNFRSSGAGSKASDCTVLFLNFILQHTIPTFMACSN